MAGPGHVVSSIGIPQRISDVDGVADRLDAERHVAFGSRRVHEARIGDRLEGTVEDVHSTLTEVCREEAPGGGVVAVDLCDGEALERWRRVGRRFAWRREHLYRVVASVPRED